MGQKFWYGKGRKNLFEKNKPFEYTCREQIRQSSFVLLEMGIDGLPEYIYFKILITAAALAGGVPGWINL